jgi:hypothetical protein
MKTGKQLGNEPAIPTIEFNRYTDDCRFNSNTTEGLTKREYFAGLAMQSIIQHGIPEGLNCSENEYAAHWGVLYADSLLAELSNKY